MSISDIKVGSRWMYDGEIWEIQHTYTSYVIAIGEKYGMAIIGNNALLLKGTPVTSTNSITADVNTELFS